MLMGLTPFIEEQALWEQISNPNAPDTDGSAGDWNAMGPTPNRSNYGPWSTEIPTLRCPQRSGCWDSVDGANELRRLSWRQS